MKRTLAPSGALSANDAKRPRTHAEGGIIKITKTEICDLSQPQLQQKQTQEQHVISPVSSYLSSHSPSTLEPKNGTSTQMPGGSCSSSLSTMTTKVLDSQYPLFQPPSSSSTAKDCHSTSYNYELLVSGGGDDGGQGNGIGGFGRDIFPLELLPGEIMVEIIRHLTLTLLNGLMFASKRFYRLVWQEVTSVILQKDREVTHINSVLRTFEKFSHQSLKVLVTWALPVVAGPVNDSTMQLVSNFTNLNVLIFGKTRISSITDAGVPYLSALTKLTHLEFDYCKVSASSLQVFKKLSQITNLRIRGFTVSVNSPANPCPEESVLAPLAHLPLRRLGLWCGSGRIKDSEFKYLTGLTALEELILANCTRVDNASFSYFSSLQRLGHLGIFHDDISDASFEHLLKIPKLRSMHLGGCWSLTDAAVGKIVQMQALTHLAITRAPHLTDVGLSAICKLPLKCLHLSNCAKIGDEALHLINQIPTLTRLDLETSGSITDNGIKIIAQHEFLREIRLVAMQSIGDEGLFELTKLAPLNTLFIKNCLQITRRGVDQLVKSHVNTWVNDLVVRYKPFSPTSAPADGLPDEEMIEVMTM